MAGLFAHAGASYALAPSAPINQEIYIAGATAQDDMIVQLIKDFCQTGTADVYFDATGAAPAKAGANHRAVSCTVDSTKVPGLSITPFNVLVHKTSTNTNNGTQVAIGGSGIGVGPVMQKTPIDVMNINAGNCTAPAGTETFYRCTARAATTDIKLAPADAGVSDVDPGMFIGANTPDGVAPVDITKVSSLLNVVPGAQTVMGVVVTKTLRDALQLAEIAAGILPATCTSGDETEACMPTLDTPMLSSIFSGNLGKWDKIYFNGQPLTSYGTAPDNTKVYIARRTNGSGTQATINAHILNNPCASGALSPAATSNILAGPIVTLNAGSGDVETVMVDFNSGTNASGKNAALAKVWAIGVQSTEKNLNDVKNYRQIKVDGVAPTIENAAKGKFSLVAESTWQWLKSGGPAGDTLKIVQKIAAEAGNPTLLGQANAGFKHLYGNGGYLAISANGWAVDPTGNLAAAPVSPYTRAPNGLALDNCRVPVIDSNNISGQ